MKICKHLAFLFVRHTGIYCVCLCHSHITYLSPLCSFIIFSNWLPYQQLLLRVICMYFFFSIYLSFILCHCNSLRILSTPFMISGLLSASRAKYLGHLKILSKVHFITEIPLGLNFCHKSLLSCKFLTSSWGTLECGKWKEPNVTVQFALCLQLGRN